MVKSLGGSLDTSPEASIRLRAVVRALSDLEESTERMLPTSDLIKYFGSLEFILTRSDRRQLGEVVFRGLLDLVVGWGRYHGRDIARERSHKSR